MVKTETPVKGHPTNEEIINAVLKKIGGKPANFHKATCTQVHSDTYRVNIYTSTTSGESWVPNPQVFYSEFYYLPS